MISGLGSKRAMAPRQTETQAGRQVTGPRPRARVRLPRGPLQQVGGLSADGSLGELLQDVRQLGGDVDLLRAEHGVGKRHHSSGPDRDRLGESRCATGSKRTGQRVGQGRLPPPSRAALTGFSAGSPRMRANRPGCDAPHPPALLFQPRLLLRRGIQATRHPGPRPRALLTRICFGVAGTGHSRMRVCPKGFWRQWVELRGLFAEEEAFLAGHPCTAERDERPSHPRKEAARTGEVGLHVPAAPRSAPEAAQRRAASARAGLGPAAGPSRSGEPPPGLGGGRPRLLARLGPAGEPARRSLLPQGSAELGPFQCFLLVLTSTR